MRNGKVLIEDSPQQIMIKYNTDNLDECYLLISHEQEQQNSLATENHIINENADGKIILNKDYKETSIFGMLPYTSKSKLKALIMKNYWHLTRQYSSVKSYGKLEINNSFFFILDIYGLHLCLQLSNALFSF